MMLGAPRAVKRVFTTGSCPILCTKREFAIFSLCRHIAFVVTSCTIEYVGLAVKGNDLGRPGASSQSVHLISLVFANSNSVMK